jgi:hypothetical protein
LFTLSYAGAITVARRGLKYANNDTTPFLMAAAIGMTSFMIAMAFSDIHGAATYVWAFTGLALRIAVAEPLDGSGHSAIQGADRRWSSDHA